MSKNNKKIFMISFFCGLLLISIPTSAMKNIKTNQPIEKITTYNKENLVSDMCNFEKTLEDKFNNLTNFENKILEIKNLNNILSDATEEKKSELIKEQIKKIKEFKTETENLIYEFKKKLYENDVTLHELINCRKNSNNIYDNITNILINFGEKYDEIIQIIENNFKVKKAVLKILKKDDNTKGYINSTLGSYQQWIDSQNNILTEYYNDILRNSYTKKNLNKILEKIKEIKEKNKQKKLEIEKDFKEQDINYYDIIKLTKEEKPKDIYVQRQQMNLKPHLYKESTLIFEEKIENILNLINQKTKNSYSEQTIENYTNQLKKYNNELKEIYIKIKDKSYDNHEEIENRYNEIIEKINELTNEIKNQDFSEIVNNICDFLKTICEQNQKEISNFSNKILKMLKNNEDIKTIELYNQTINIQNNILQLISIDENLQKKSNHEINEIQNYVELLSRYHKNLQEIYEKFLNNKYFKFSPYDNEELTNAKNEYKTIIENLNKEIEKIKSNQKNTITNDIIKKTTTLISLINKNTTDIKQYVLNYIKFKKLNQEISNIIKKYKEDSSLSLNEIYYIEKIYSLTNAISKIILNIEQFDVTKQKMVNSFLNLKENEMYSIFEKNDIDYNKNINEIGDEEIEVIKDKILNLYDIQKKFFEILELINPEEKINIINPADIFLILKNTSLTESSIIDFFKSQKDALVGEKLTKNLAFLEYFLSRCYEKIQNNLKYDKEQLKKDLKNIKTILSQWCKLGTNFYNNKILALLKNIENSTEKIPKNYEKTLNVLKNFISENKEIPKDFDLTQNEIYQNIIYLMEKIEKCQPIDKTLERFKRKICRMNISMPSIHNVNNLKIIEKEYNNYCNERIKNDPFNENELKIKKVVENRLNRYKDKYKIDNINKKEGNEKSKFFENLEEYLNKFKNADYSSSNMYNLTKLKEEYEKRKKTIIESDYLSEEEINLVAEISTYTKKIEKLIEENSNNNSNNKEKTSTIDNKLESFHKNFKDSKYNISNLQSLTELKKEYENYLNKMLNSNALNENEIKLTNEISDYIKKIENLITENSKNNLKNSENTSETHNALKKYLDDLRKAFSKKDVYKLTYLKDRYKVYMNMASNKNSNSKLINEITSYIKQIDIIIARNSNNNFNNKEKNLTTDNELESYYEKFKNSIYDINNLQNLTKLKEKYDNYINRYLNNRLDSNVLDKDEINLIDKISDYIKQIENLIEENSKNIKDKYLWKYKILKTYYEKFESANYSSSNIDELKKLKEEYEQKDFMIGIVTEEEKDLMNKISDYTTKIENLITENSNNKEKKPTIDNELESYYEKFKNSSYDINNLQSLTELKKEYEKYLENRMKYNPYSDDEFKIAIEISTYTKKIENLIEEKSNNKEKKPTIDNELESFYKNFKNSSYDINNLQSLTELKKEYEKYLDNRMEHNPCSDDEFEIAREISTYTKKIENLIEKNSNNKEKNFIIPSYTLIYNNMKNDFDQYEEENKKTEINNSVEFYDNFFSARNNDSIFNDDELKYSNREFNITETNKNFKNTQEEYLNFIDKKNYNDNLNKEKILIKNLEIPKKEILTEKPKIDSKFKNYEEKFKNFDYNHYDISNLKQLKEEFENYIAEKNEKKPLNKEEKKLRDEIYDNIYKIEDIFYEIANDKENKKPKVDKVLVDFYNKFNNSQIDNNNIDNLKKLKGNFENYLSERIKKSLFFTHEEYLIFMNISLKIYEIIEIFEKNSEYVNKEKNYNPTILKYWKIFYENNKNNKNKKTQEVTEKLKILEIGLDIGNKQFYEAYHYIERFHLPTKIDNIENLLFEKKELLIKNLFFKIQTKIKFISEIEKKLLNLKNICLENCLNAYLIERIESNLTKVYTIKKIITLDINNIISFFEKLIKKYENDNSSTKKDISDLKKCLKELKNINNI